MRLPLDVVDLIKSTTQIQKERERPVRLALFIEPDAPDSLIEAAQAAFRPFTAAAQLHIEVVEPGTRLVVDSSADAVIALVGGCGPDIVESLAAARERAVPAVAVAIAEETMPVAEALRHPYRDTIASTDEVHLIHVELGEWLVERIAGKRLALAHNYAFMRRAVAVEHVKNTAMQNALVGAVMIIPGADMPIMTANQAKMVLQIAAAYGEQLGTERVRELLPVLGGGYVLRTAARQVVTLVPGFGWAIKGGIGYTGTIAMGFAAIKYFEHSTDLGDLEIRLKEYGTQVGQRLRSLSRKDAARLLRRGQADVSDALPSAEPSTALPPSEPAASLPAAQAPAAPGVAPAHTPIETPAGE